MKTNMTLERVETNHGVVKIEGEIRGATLVVQKLWAMSTDGWEEIDQKCHWAKTIFDSSADNIIMRTIEKYGSAGKQLTRVVGS